MKKTTVHALWIKEEVEGHLCATSLSLPSVCFAFFLLTVVCCQMLPERDPAPHAQRRCWCCFADLIMQITDN